MDYRLTSFPVDGILLQARTILLEFQPGWVRSFVFRSRIVAISAFRTRQGDDYSHASAPLFIGYPFLRLQLLFELYVRLIRKLVGERCPIQSHLLVRQQAFVQFCR